MNVRFKQREPDKKICDDDVVIVVAVHGSSGSLQDENDTFMKPLSRAFESSKKWKAGLIKVFEFDHHGRMETKIRSVLRDNPPLTEHAGLYFAGKSFGAAQLHGVVKNNLGRILEYGKRCIVTIDPHAPFGKAGPTAPINANIYAPLIPCQNVYQVRTSPRGAIVMGARNIEVTDADVTHFNIIDKPASITTYLWGCYKIGILGLTT